MNAASRMDAHDARKQIIEDQMRETDEGYEKQMNPIKTTSTVEVMRNMFPEPNKSKRHSLVHRAANELEAALVTIAELETECDRLRGGTRVEKLIAMDEALDK